MSECKCENELNEFRIGDHVLVRQDLVKMVREAPCRFRAEHPHNYQTRPRKVIAIRLATDGDYYYQVSPAGKSEWENEADILAASELGKHFENVGIKYASNLLGEDYE